MTKKFSSKAQRSEKAKSLSFPSSHRHRQLTSEISSKSNEVKQKREKIFTMKMFIKSLLFARFTTRFESSEKVFP
jgi:hypothetical protein